MIKKQYAIIIGIVIAIIFVKLPNGNNQQTIVPECFDNQDCWVPVQEGYCEAEYGCVAGKCTSVQIRCPEECTGNEDEDMDGLYDCKDPDCFDDPDCHCDWASFNYCTSQTCFCPDGMNPKWFVQEEDSYCECRFT